MSEYDFLEKAEQFGDILIKKDIINLATYEKAREVYIENHINRTLDENFRIRFISQILVEDFNADSDIVYHEMAVSYSFKELDIPVKDIPESHIKWMRDEFNTIDPSNQEKMIRYEVIPYMMWADYYDRHKAAMKFERLKNKYIILSVNPGNFKVPQITFSVYGASAYEVIVIKKKEFEKLIKIIKEN